MPPSKEQKLENQHIQVAVRLRPINSIEKKQGSYSVVACNNDRREITVKEKLGVNPNTKTYGFDHAFSADVEQVQIYNTVVTPIINEVLSGYNCTIFAYGQTGTGKTFTMEGERSDDPSMSWEKDPLTGIIPRSLAHIFDSLQKQDVEFSVRVSFLELYNEELFDLLGSSDDPLRLRIYEDNNRKGSVIITGLEDIVVRSKDEVYEILERGAARRQTAATLMNAHSSRSHSVFSITIHIKENTIEGEELLKTGKLYLVDLAGSENIGRSGAVDKRAREAGSINQSLLTLGRVITALVEHAPHIPYRESKLTRLLQDSLGGRTKTSIIATISPASVNLEETLSTLDYAHRAKNITNRPEVNQKLTKRALIKEYNQEIEKLQRDLQAAREKNGFYIAEDNYKEMQSRLLSNEDTITELTQKLEATEEEMQKTLELFTEVKQELTETAEKLTETKEALVDTKHTLKETKVTLRQTEQERDEQEFLVTKHVQTETHLHADASKLLDTVEDSTSDVSKLHDKLDRKRHVESHNEQCQLTFEERFHSETENMANVLQSFVVEQQTFQRASKDYIEEQVQKTRVSTEAALGSLTSLQSDLRDQISDLAGHLKLSATNSVSALTEIKSQVSETMVEEEERVCRLQEFVSGNMASVMDNIKSITSSLTDIQEQLDQQREEEDRLRRQRSDQLLAALAALGSTVTAHNTEQKEKICQLTTTVNKRFANYDTKEKEFERRIMEVLSFREEIKNEVRNLREETLDSNKTMEASSEQATADVHRQLESVCSTTRDEMETSSKASAARCERLQQQLKKETVTSRETGEMCSQVTQRVTEDNTASRQMAERLSKDISDKCLQQTTQTITELEQSSRHTEILQQSCQKGCVSMKETRETEKREFEEEATQAESVLESRMEATLHFSDSQATALSDRNADVTRYIHTELKQDIPTGLTPVRRDFVYPNNLVQTDSHHTLLEEFRRDHPLNLDIEEESDQEVQIQVTECSDVDADQADPDNQADAVSVASSRTSGVSVTSGKSGMSTATDKSKMSETKENAPKGRPLGAKRRKMMNNVNTTPRGKTRLPLRSANSSHKTEAGKI